MYQRMKMLCSTQNRESGPGIDAEIFFSDPALQEDCISHVTMVSRKEYSRYVSELLDRLGYSYNMIEYRQHVFNKTDRLYNHDETRDLKVVTTGGKGEGTSLFHESDFDHMYILKDVIGADYPQHFSHKKNITIFRTERQDTSPGYARLRLLRFGGNRCDYAIRLSVTDSHYLSSQLFTNYTKISLRDYRRSGRQLTTEDTSGPSNPMSDKMNNYDNVMCFICCCPDILERWVTRPRYHGWPSQDTIHEISLLDGHVVPVGLKGSQNMYKEWRICYSLAELHLMRKCNEIQLKVYILLKKISKVVLNPVCEDMTSYIMKNVVFWMCEANGLERFSNDQLMDRMLDCIKYLRTCVSENNLPSYMIPDRNLLAGRLDIQQRQQLTSLLGDLLHEGGRMLLRCERLRDAMLVMYKISDTCRAFGEKRDKLESLWLIKLRLRIELQRSGMSEEELNGLVALNEENSDMQAHIDLLIRFDEQALKQMGKTDEEIQDLFNERIKLLLS